MYKILFVLIEIFLFIFPILPSSFYVRLAIGISYYIAHVLKTNVYYARMKYYLLNKKNRDDDTTDYTPLNTAIHTLEGLTRNVTDTPFVLSNENIAKVE